jgi:hypothetical protein
MSFGVATSPKRWVASGWRPLLDPRQDISLVLATLHNILVLILVAEVALHARRIPCEKPLSLNAVQVPDSVAARPGDQIVEAASDF